MTFYKVYLIESGSVHHFWQYDCIDDALKQFNRLLKVFEDVPNVTPLMLPVDSSQLTTPLYSLLNSLV